ncbi:hypothetical protein TWF694_009030 [Orbilia ellipsospora]|uniref:Zn(2)-C6 fungal-type domain-containing protein n=1 Tax=Orbilia ellipsospora TaxID=2528407 RepID=A0AAV9XK46_9PEZI
MAHTADMSEFTSVFRARVNLNDKRKSNRRNRQALSCLACRTRKLKCDRQYPCAACSKRGEGSSCSFANGAGPVANGSNGISKQSGTVNADAKRSEAQAKLQKLEELVQQLLQSGAVVSKPSDTEALTPKSSTEISTNPINRTTSQLDQNEESGISTKASSADKEPSAFMCYNETTGGYAGATHWSALLEQIAGVRESLETATDSNSSDTVSHLASSEDSPITDDGDLIFTSNSSNGHITVEDAVNSLPPRFIADQLLNIYNTVKFANALFIHRIKFQREYDAFWKDHSSASMMWISVLYSVMCLGAMMAKRQETPVFYDSYDIEPMQLNIKARQCLIAGHHTKNQPYVIEALIIYIYCKYQLNMESDSTLWALSGYITRIAQRLGYHRDPKRLGKRFTPLQAEMRRRTWFWVSTFDLIFSFQYGMPSIIQDEQCDTEPPGNYHDEDFDEDTIVMPPPRPPTEFTNMLYYCHKIKVTTVFRKVIRQALALKLPDYGEILQLDKDLDDIHDEIPPVMRLRGSIRDCSLTDEPNIILHRIVLELTYHKCLCVLHRSYLTFDKENPRYEYSRKRARASALRILDFQSDAYDESQPGGRLWDERWMITSLTLHDFLLASMILCLDVNEKIPNGSISCNRLINTLQKAYKIWSEKKHVSKDAFHASNVLGAMLARIASTAPEQKANMIRVGTPTPSASTLQIPWLGNSVTYIPMNKNTTPALNGLGPNVGGGLTSTPQTVLPFHRMIITNDMVGAAGGDVQDRAEQPGEFVPREITAREEAFGLGFGNDVYPMIESFQPLDFDTLMGESGNFDWGLVDRYLFDKGGSSEERSNSDASMQVPAQDDLMGDCRQFISSPARAEDGVTGEFSFN